MGAWDTLKGMNEDEKDALWNILKKNPLNGLTVKSAMDEANRWARQLAHDVADRKESDAEAKLATRRALLHNGPVDAIRHCYWSAILASRLAYNDAMMVVITHEFGAIHSTDELQKLEGRMDIHNNKVGLNTGHAAKGATFEFLRVRVSDAMAQGKLKVIDRKQRKLVPLTSMTQGIG